ncbi:viroplasmin family protein [Paraliobacillus sediminis]|uniref:ribonuclease H1 domain-containing protein n=1 Tax=Paraliobacillus sediminis TaxID=1885916 RepID=UPI000E3D81D7|nr:ribonuclease H family protein [Paraliobacillus sediminis]
MAKKKYYVVWVGKNAGIYDTWDACKKQVIGIKGARYKSFLSKEEAESAFKNGPKMQTNSVKKDSKNEQISSKNKTTFIEDSISVDAACSGNPGVMEYKGVYTKDSEELFHFGPVANGTNNIGEFLAIVHALVLLKEQNSSLPIYTDSKTAISWVSKKHANTTIPRDFSTEHLWKLIDRATNWLNQNNYTTEIIKWETKLWGESKADFGRKSSSKY